MWDPRPGGHAWGRKNVVAVSSTKTDSREQKKKKQKEKHYEDDDSGIQYPYGTGGSRILEKIFAPGYAGLRPSLRLRRRP
jgi:hypothetical protein